MAKNYKKSFFLAFPLYGQVKHLICDNVVHLIMHDVNVVIITPDINPIYG